MKARLGITIVGIFIGVIPVSNIQPINHLTHTISSGDIERNRSANDIAADQGFFAHASPLEDQTISATPLFSDGTSIQEITHSIINCIIDS